MSKDLPDMFRLDDRVALVTGGAGLLGSEYTRTLLRAGAKVCVADINADAAASAASAAASDAGGESLGYAVDIRRKADVDRMIDAIVAKWGRLDILVNNAAIDPKFDASVASQQSNTFEDYPEELWQQSLDVNLTGAFFCCQAAGKRMVAAGRGAIVNIASTYGVVAPDQRLYQRDGEQQQKLFKPASYAVTKAGLAHLTRYLAVYWGSAGVRVNTLTPHGIYNSQDDQFLRRYAERCPLGRMATKQEMNGALLFLVSDASSYMTGANLVVDGGWTAW